MTARRDAARMMCLIPENKLDMRMQGSIADIFMTDGESLYQNLVLEQGLEPGVAPALELGETGDFLKLAERRFPWSLKHKEFDFVRSLIASFGLQRGFEVATGFGVSTLAIALGLKASKGVCVSMDAYIEESFDDWIAYDGQRKVGDMNALGYRSASALLEKFNLSNRMSLAVGWSPDDVGAVITAKHGEYKLDFAFIDGLHTEDAVVTDMEAVLPHLGENFVILLHDSHDFGRYVEGYFRGSVGGRWSRPRGLAFPQGFELAYYARGFDVAAFADRFEAAFWDARSLKVEGAEVGGVGGVIGGGWRWFTGWEIEVTPDLSILRDGAVAGYVTPLPKNRFAFVWGDGKFIDFLRLEPGATTLTGVSNHGVPVHAARPAAQAA
jgi:predicted O-methyltransferase YrrM